MYDPPPSPSMSLLSPSSAATALVVAFGLLADNRRRGETLHSLIERYRESEPEVYAGLQELLTFLRESKRWSETFETRRLTRE